jgi:hypothetical protein
MNVRGKEPERCTFSEKTIDRWKHEPAFISMIDAAKAELRRRMMDEGAAAKELRILAKRRRIRALMRILRARAGNEDRGGVAWDSSGFMVRKERCIGSGENARFIVEYKLDQGILSQLSKLEREIAEEKGELGVMPQEPAQPKTVSKNALTLVQLFAGDVEALQNLRARVLELSEGANGGLPNDSSSPLT